MNSRLDHNPVNPLPTTTNMAASAPLSLSIHNPSMAMMMGRGGGGVHRRRAATTSWRRRPPPAPSCARCGPTCSRVPPTRSPRRASPPSPPASRSRVGRRGRRGGRRARSRWCSWTSTTPATPGPWCAPPRRRAPQRYCSAGARWIRATGSAYGRRRARCSMCPSPVEVTWAR